MKNRLSLIIVCCLLMLSGCSYDNYDEPTSVLSGRVVYNGQALPVKTDGTGFILWQDGYANKSGITLNIAYDGTFSATLFDGEYKLTRRAGGPRVDQPADTVYITVRGNTVVDVPVTPYFTIRDASFQYYDGKVKATFKVDKVVESANVSRLTLCLGKSILTDYNKKEANKTLSNPVISFGEEMTLEADLGSLAGEEYVFARVGVRAAQSSNSEFVYSLPVKVMIR
ncbi:DUF3823 domain-containing protein [Bacteroides ovatus]|nr:DUF3823 domain-containing protein [Bacteroides ovatus]